MKKYCLLLIFLSLNGILLAQTNDFQTLLNNGKAEFKKEFDEQDYQKAVDNLEKAVALKPNDAEANYYLGYAYSRLNSKDGESIIKMDVNTTLKVSSYFEKVIQISPQYKGDIVSLDPYSKISSEWGSLAAKYLYEDKLDSAKWAFKTGKKKGTFSAFKLAICQKTLQKCQPNAIIISSGDNLTFSLWYLQTVKNIRTDVSVVDISLLNSKWYPHYLKDKNLVDFNLNDIELDTLEYSNWKDSLITIKNFSWVVSPSYHDAYLLRGDRLFLSLLQNNEFDKPIYFTIGFAEDMRLNLNDYTSSLIVSDQLTLNSKIIYPFKAYLKDINHIFKMAKKLNMNSTDERRILENFRYEALFKMNDLIRDEQFEHAKILMQALEKNLNPEKFPYLYNETPMYVQLLKNRLEKNN